VSVPLAERLKGVTAVLIAPFSGSTGGINSELAQVLARRCDEAGVAAVTVLGNTAELYQLDPSERFALLRAVGNADLRAVKIAGLAGPPREIYKSAEDAARLGYDALMLHEPPDPFGSDAGLRTYMLGFANSLELPLILYIRTRRPSTTAILDLIQHPRIVAVKYAVPDVGAATSLLQDDSLHRYCTWICGAGESYLAAFAALGMQGFTSGLANARPDLAVNIWQALKEKDLELLHARLRIVLPFEVLRNSNGGRYNVAVLKESLRLQGLDAGSVRPPCAELDSTSREELTVTISNWNSCNREAMEQLSRQVR
jgi:dihydrodipicolinate synthase/N-acetylneuraminate lyase